MTKKIVSFLNPNYQQGPKYLNAFYLPYTSGVLWSYASQFDEVNENYALGEFIWKRENIDDVVERLKNHHIICVSGYVWNRKYNHKLCIKLKEANPNLIFVAGGPDYPIHKPNLAERYPYIDCFVKSEGEVCFKNILVELTKDNPNILSIRGLLVRVNREIVDTGDSDRINDLDQIPSPYTTGVFDHLMRNAPNVTWNAIVETNRGCPYMCTFCDWGSLTYSKVKKFEIDRVFSEIEWFGRNKIDFVSFTDANFGIFPERDMKIAEKVIEVRNKYSHPDSYTMSWAKNQKESVIDIVSKLSEGGNRTGLNISLQSLDEGVLTAIKRKNLEIHKIAEAAKICESKNIPVYTEIILGLPEETLQSWKNTYYSLFEYGTHDMIQHYQAILLENAEMNLTQREKYGLKGLHVYGNIFGAPLDNDSEIEESLEIVIETDTLPHHDMIAAMIFNWYMTTFHVAGLTNWASRFLRKYKNVSYEDFYEDLFEFIKQDPWLNSEIKRIEENCIKWVETGKILENVSIKGHIVQWWSLPHTTSMMIQVDNLHDHVFAVISKYLEKFELPAELRNDIIKTQKKFFMKYEDLAQYPMQLEMKYDIIGYLQNNDLLESKCTYEFDYAFKGFDFGNRILEYTIGDYCGNYYYGRKQQFGKAKITKL